MSQSRSSTGSAAISLESVRWTRIVTRLAGQATSASRTVAAGMVSASTRSSALVSGHSLFRYLDR